MQRTRGGFVTGFDTLLSTGKELLGGWKGSASLNSVLSMARFRGKLGAAIAVITSLIVGFLTLSNNILYLIDSTRAPWGRVRSDSGSENVGIAVIVLGCLAMALSMVLSLAAAKSKRKMDGPDYGNGLHGNRNTRAVLACLVMMNVELFMSVVMGCMELFYRPLIRDERKLQNVESIAAAFNIVIYVMYVITMMLMATVLKEKHAGESEYQRNDPEPTINPS